MTRFADLIGQELAAAVLARLVREDKVTHAYLFAGPQGAGKRTTALALAAALNCEQPDGSGDSCGNCASCQMVEGDRHPDVEVISPAGAKTKIDQMRDMRKSVYYVPVRGKWKVVIIEQADTLNEDSSSCILKTLEEPPQYLIMILLSRNPVLLLPTIRSRCLQVRFSHVGFEALARALVERRGAGEEEARFLAAYSEGRPGAAISLLGDEGFFSWRGRMIDLAAEICSRERVHAIRLSYELQRLASPEKDDTEDGDPAEPDERPALTGKRAAMLRALDTLVLWYRDLLNLSIRGGAAELINSDVRDRLSACRSNQARASSDIRAILWARRAIEGNANIGLVSDVMVTRLMRGA